MEGYDILMLALLVGSTLFGAYKGLTWQVASIASMLVSYGAAYRFRSTLANWISADPPWNIFASMLIVYATSSLGIWSICQMIRDLIERVRLKEFDRQMGALFGFAKGVIFCSIVTLFAVTLLGDAQRRNIVHSRSGHYIARFLHDAAPVMPVEVKEVIGPYLDEFGAEVESVIAEEGGAPEGTHWARSSSGNREPTAEETARTGGGAFGPLIDAMSGSEGDSEKPATGSNSSRRVLDEFRRWTDRGRGSFTR
jgi:membrane protein required for colicin V production